MLQSMTFMVHEYIANVGTVGRFTSKQVVKITQEGECSVHEQCISRSYNLLPNSPYIGQLEG